MTQKALFLNSQGIVQRLPDGSIINIGGTSWPTFTVNGIGIVLADGSTTTGGTLNLQTVYNGSIDINGDASIKLLSGRDFVVYDDTNNSIFFKIDSETGKVTITGDLEVVGTSVIVDSVIQDADHWRISPASAITTALKIEPEFNSPIVDLVSIKNIVGGPIVFKIDKDGKTHLTDLFVSNDITISGDIITSGLVDGVDISTLDTTVGTINSTLTTVSSDVYSHITFNASPKHAASEISVIAPSYAPLASNVQEVLDALTPLLGGGGGGSSSAGLFITNVAPTSTGIVGNKQYVSGTIPANAVISQATTDTDNVRISFIVEGDSAFYSPTVTVDTVPGPGVIATLSEHATDKRLFNGYADIVVSTTRTITLSSSIGIGATVQIVRASAGPVIQSLNLGPYPGSQTVAKSGDVITVSGTVENAATYIEVIGGGAANTGPFVLVLGISNSGGAGYKTYSGSFTVSGLSGSQSIVARAKNTLGTYGPNFASALLTLDQAYPIIGPITVTYPLTQSAIKGSETANVNSTVSGHTSVVYSSSADLSVALPTTYNVNKTVTRIGGNYVDSGFNYTITANKASNGTVTVVQGLVKIANTPPTAIIAITGNPTRLRSSPSGNVYTVNLTSSQNLSAAPTLTVTSGILSAFTGSGKNWSATITINDSHPKGTQSFTITSMVNEALVSGTGITSGQNYIVGGFITHSVVFPAFARYAPIGTPVVDVSKTTAKYAGAGSNLTYHSDTGDYFQGYAIVDSGGVFDPTGTHLFISDAAYAGANTSGTLTLEITEVA